MSTSPGPAPCSSRAATLTAIACHECLEARRIAGNDLARVDADPERDPRCEAPLELLVQRRKSRLHLERCPAGTEGVVLVRLRHTEDREHGVADELLHRAAVPLERRAHLVEVREHQAPYRLRVCPFANRRRPGKIAEDECRELPPLGGGLCERGAAVPAVPKPLRILPAAIRADGHAKSLGRFPARHGHRPGRIRLPCQSSCASRQFTPRSQEGAERREAARGARLRRAGAGRRPGKRGGPCRDRTCDLGIKSPLLYQLS